MPTFIVFRQRYGGSSNEVVSAAGVTNLADLDQSPAPVVKAMGEAGYKQYLAKRAELVEHSETNIFRFRKDLSYQPATSGQVTGVPLHAAGVPPLGVTLVAITSVV